MVKPGSDVAGFLEIFSKRSEARLIVCLSSDLEPPPAPNQRYITKMQSSLVQASRGCHRRPDSLDPPVPNTPELCAVKFNLAVHALLSTSDLGPISLD